MKKSIHALLIAFAISLGTAQVHADDVSSSVGATMVPDSTSLEKSLQSLEWGQFKSVVEAIPKLKADVDAYGPLGWQYVEANYRTYSWKRSIDKLDDEQKRHLASLIESVKKTR